MNKNASFLTKRSNLILVHHNVHTLARWVVVHSTVTLCWICRYNSVESDKIFFFFWEEKKGKAKAELSSSCGGVDVQLKLDGLSFPPLSLSISHTLLPRHWSAPGNVLHSCSWQLFSHFQQAKGKNTAGSLFSYFLSLVVCSHFHSFFRSCVKEEWITIALADGRTINYKHMQDIVLLDDWAERKIQKFDIASDLRAFIEIWSHTVNKNFHFAYHGSAFEHQNTLTRVSTKKCASWHLNLEWLTAT